MMGTKLSIEELRRLPLRTRIELEENWVREDLPPSVSVKVARLIRPVAEEAAKERRAATQGNKQTGVGKFPEPEKGRAADKTAAAVGMDRKTLQKAEAVVKAAEQQPELFGDLAEKMDRTGNVNGAYGEMIKRRNEQRTHEWAKKARGAALPEFISMKCGDGIELMRELPDDSISLIFTDPPYAREYIPLYGQLAEVAKTKLKPGGSLISYVGHYALPEVFELMTPHLRYWWLLAIKEGTQKARMFGTGVYVTWKPCIWFTRGARAGNRMVDDLVQSHQPKKIIHPWEQSTDEALYYIEHLTLPGDLVCDPFMGSGTTLLAALTLGRRGWGCDIDKRTVALAKSRMVRHHARPQGASRP
jgi:16S rRNA G966 N2-methylase RsmD